MAAKKKTISSSELRSAFLEFFRARGHAVVSSSPLVPGNDPTLLFTNAGMVQFKDVFLGKDQRSYKRAASSQRCVRAGGKHNDLENVGYTARHHTFFEMLGNFSFGDYFKREAIEFAWDFVTGTLKIPPEKLWVSVYKDDNEAADLWLKKIKIDPKRFARLGESSNFWAMGDTGPCGPCSEIFYDHGRDIKGGPPGSKREDGDRYVEIWNLVFMQYERSADGKTTPLPKPSVDTGMGLERTAAVMQGVHSNYEIDLFQGLIAAASEATGQKKKTSPSLRVIADHIRACSFLIVDGVIPGNDGRGYVLRRIIRRAIRHGYKLGQDQPFFHQLVPALVAEMGEAYPELPKSEAHVTKVLKQEEERFAETLENGMKLLETAMAKTKGKTIAGETVFKLYDTFGFPVDLTADIARERGLKIDQPGFEKAMQSQRERGRASSQFGVDLQATLKLPTLANALKADQDCFVGYDQLQGQGRIKIILKDGVEAISAASGDEVQIVLDKTPFYAEAGGQVGDVGTIETGKAKMKVSDTKKHGDAHLHIGRVVSGVLKTGDKVTAKVDATTRQATVLNHSATHLLHAALRKVLGTHVIQKGSLVAPDRLRFDFSHTQAVTPQELESIEHLVNAEIRRNVAADIRQLPYDEAIKSGAMALFGEKYGDEVRVLKFGDFSTELCGGTHVNRTGDIGYFRITSEGGIASGIRRIEALTGEGALEAAKATDLTLRRVAAVMRATPAELEDKVNLLLERQKKLEREMITLKAKLAFGAGGVDLANQAVQVNGVAVLAATIDGADVQTLREAADRYKSRFEKAVIVLAAITDDGKVTLVSSVTPNLTKIVHAGQLIGQIAGEVGGKGGGRPDFAQAGGNDASRLPAALESVARLVAGLLAER